MKYAFDHGPRLTQREYEQAIVELHSDSPGCGLESDSERIRRRELDLTIDYRLGTCFPNDRRNEIWRIQQVIEKKRLRLAAFWLAGRLMPRLLDRKANHIAQFVIRQYAKVLTAEELEAYFGAEEVRRPSLPLNRP